MKNILLLTLLLASTMMFAQPIFNPKVGLNFSKYNTEGDINIHTSQARVGFNAGFDARFSQKRIYILSGLHYFNTGIEMQDLEDPQFTPTGFNIHTVKMPFNIGLNFLEIDWVRLRALGGATANLNVGVNENPFFTRDDLYPATGALNWGLGVDLWKLTVDVIMEYGMTNMFKESYTDANVRNNIVSVNVGIVF
jgi:hypothetical protein